MSDEQNIAKFESHAMEIMQSLNNIAIKKKEIESSYKKIHDELERLCIEYDVKQIDNEFVKITFVEGSSSISIDLKKLQSHEPDLYDELLNDYPKQTTRKPSVRITAKARS